MGKLAKAIFLQAFWYLSVMYGGQYQLAIFLSSIIIVFANYFIFRPEVTKAHYVFCFFFFLSYGVLEETILKSLGFVSYGQSSFPLWLTSLWVVFLCYYGDILNNFKTWSFWKQFALGGVGGVFAFFGGVKLSNMEVLSNLYFLGVFISWGFFFPLSIRIFYKKLLWNKILDWTIVYSFDRTGYLRHKEGYYKPLNKGNSESKYLITGGTSGIGLSIANTLNSDGNDVFVTGRNFVKGESVAKDGIGFVQLDMGDLEKIEDVVKTLPVLDGIVLNAGGMSLSFNKTKEGIEEQAASQLFGHYKLLELLDRHQKIKTGSKVVWVSSGGMYLSKLNIRHFTENLDLDKVGLYGNIKRAQVTLLDYMRDQFKKYTVVGMHPGWVDTYAVRTYIPDFYEKMSRQLRSPEEGADTIYWLLKTDEPIVSGGFYFDRKRVPKTIFGLFKPSRKEESELISLVNKVTT